MLVVGHRSTQIYVGRIGTTCSCHHYSVLGLQYKEPKPKNSNFFPVFRCDEFAVGRRHDHIVMWKITVNFLILHCEAFSNLCPARLTDIANADAYIIACSLLGFFILYGYGNVPAIDALFFGASGSTESGLNTCVARFDRKPAHR